MRHILVAVLAMFSITANASVIGYDFTGGGDASTGGPVGLEIGFHDGLAVTAGSQYGIPAAVNHDTSPANGGLGVWNWKCEARRYSNTDD